jgi:predicted nucleic acid-binding protein
VIYLDTSVALAQLMAEDRRPRPELWDEPLVASRLLEYELWTRLHGRGAAGSHGDAARLLLARVSLLELARPVLARALEPFPTPVRTLDALHLASAMFLRERGYRLALATFDARLRDAAEAMGLALFDV